MVARLATYVKEKQDAQLTTLYDILKRPRVEQKRAEALPVDKQERLKRLRN